MNKTVTEGIVFTPPAFSANLSQWSSGDGVPGSDTYAGAANAAFVPADADFGGCLEVLKSETVQKLRYMGQTPLQPGCYLQVKAKVKAVSGPLPSVRIAGWAGRAGGGAVPGVVSAGPEVNLTAYGDVVEVNAIVGVGNRSGVHMSWGLDAAYGHFGLDLTGGNGGVVRIDDLEITDITGAFLRDMMNWIDVRDYGAVGDGVQDDAPAFEAANTAANGRHVFVPKGQYYVGSSLTFESRVRFEGSLIMPTEAILALTKDFDLPSYIDALGGDEELASKKALQSLLNNADHESLDMGGRRVSIQAPIDVQAAVPNRSSYAQRRVIRNGQLRAEGGAAWDADVATSEARYSASNQNFLTHVSNIANIQVGSLVQGAGVGREVYVREIDVSAQEIRLSQPLSDAVGVQNYTFTRFKYILDFTGFERINVFEIEDVEFQCNTMASGLILPPMGTVNVIRNCVFNRPLNRGITSPGDACQGLMVDHCQFISHEGGALTQNRQSVAINTNANDVKIRNCRASQFRHFAVISGSYSVISGNHFFQGDSADGGIRSAGIVLTTRAVNCQITGNYVDNCFIEWTNEREPEPDYTGGFGFAGLSVVGNVFLCSHVAKWFGFIVVKPFGSDHIVNGFNVTGNTFRCVGGSISRVERVDTSFADLNYANLRHVHFSENTYHNIEKQTENPLMVTHTQTGTSATWQVDPDHNLPFDGWTIRAWGVTPQNRLQDSGGTTRYYAPYVEVGTGAQNNRVDVKWPGSVKGTIAMMVRMDK